MPKVVDREQRRSDIVDATIQILVKHGLEGLSMRAVAAEAQATIGMLNYWFSCKEDLVRAAIERVIEWEMPTGDTGLPASFNDLESSLHNFLPLDKKRTEQQKVWVAFEELVLKNDQLRKKHIAQYDRFRKVLRKRLRELGKSRIDLDIAVDHIIATIDGISGSAILDLERWTPQRQKKVLRQTLLLYLDQ